MEPIFEQCLKKFELRVSSPCMPFLAILRCFWTEPVAHGSRPPPQTQSEGKDMQLSSCVSSPSASVLAHDKQNYLRQEFVRLLQAEQPAVTCDNHTSTPLSNEEASQLVGFQLEVISSTVKGGGRGLMLSSGMAPRDTAVAIYAGQLYLSPPQSVQVLDTPGVKSMQKPSRSNYCIEINKGLSLDGEFADTLPAIQQNMTQYTCGHVINHGASMAHVNCEFAEVELFPGALPEDCRERLPYTRVPKNPVSVKDVFTEKIYEWPSTGRLTVVVVLATRDIHAGEELFLDYNLRPDFSMPSWFSGGSLYPGWYKKLQQASS